MRPTPSRSRRISAADEQSRCGGFTHHRAASIACSLLLLVLGVILASLDDVVKAQSYTSDRTTSLDAMRLTLNRMTRELRQASSIDETTSTPSVDRVRHVRRWRHTTRRVQRRRHGPDAAGQLRQRHQRAHRARVDEPLHLRDRAAGTWRAMDSDQLASAAEAEPGHRPRSRLRSQPSQPDRSTVVKRVAIEPIGARASR